MAELYRLPRNGGAASERFKAYLTRAPLELGLVAYNPMAGSAALETVEQLIACDAESLALATAQRVVARCGYPADITIAIAVRSAGLWTHRIGTEVDERASGKPRTPASGIVSLWSREACAASDVVRESAAECVRVMWTARHGIADTVRAVLAREGLAYAIAAEYAPLGPYAGPLADDDSIAVIDALAILGDSRASSDMAGVLLGDGVAIALGWAPLGVPDNAGYRWAIARAMQHVKEMGGSAALGNGTIP
jgi:hypothetical protein